MSTAHKIGSGSRRSLRTLLKPSVNWLLAFVPLSASASRVYSTMMSLAVISLIVPSAFERSFSAPKYLPQVRLLNSWLACSLLAVYAIITLFFYFVPELPG
jgi:Ca2+/H+ antiporter